MAEEQLNKAKQLAGDKCSIQQEKIKKNLSFKNICFLDEENETKKVIISVLKHTAVALLLGLTFHKVWPIFSLEYKEENKKNYMKPKPEASLQSYQRY